MGVAWIVCRRPTHAPLSPMHDNALMVLQMGIGPLNLSSSAGSVHGRSLWQAWVGVPTQATVRGPPVHRPTGQMKLHPSAASDGYLACRR